MDEINRNRLDPVRKRLPTPFLFLTTPFILRVTMIDVGAIRQQHIGKSASATRYKIFERETLPSIFVAYAPKTICGICCSLMVMVLAKRSVWVGISSEYLRKAVL